MTHEGAYSPTTFSIPSKSRRMSSQAALWTFDETMAPEGGSLLSLRSWNRLVMTIVVLLRPQPLVLPRKNYVDRHRHDARRATNDKDADEWMADRSIHEFPTDAFGQVEFLNEDEGSIKPSKYIRLSDQTPMALVKELLIEHWGLFRPYRPHLAISLIGGAKNFRMEGRKKETFKQGLISAAKSTNALILTGGTNTGTMKLVGDAVRQGQYLVQNGNKMSRGIKLLGLCSWGYIKDFELFVNESLKEFNYVTYNSNVEIRHGENVPLNGDHTHFLLIDDGSRYRFLNSSTDFITQFEMMVRDPEPQGLGLPIVTLLLEGGKDAIRIVKDRLREGIACVVIEGSGRAADIISYAYKNAQKKQETNSYTLKEGHVSHLMKMLDKEYGAKMGKAPDKEQQLQGIMNWTLECIRYSDIITIFDIRRETQLDKKILSALLKTDKMNLHHQLYLSMIWDRVDLVEEKLAVKDTLNSMNTLHDIMMQALLMERVNFIQLLVMNGFVMRTFLTVERLRQLYNDATLNFKELHYQLRHFTGFSGGYLYLNNIDELLVHFVKDHSHMLYRLDKPMKRKSSSKQAVDVCAKLFEEPYVELFLWAILTNKTAIIDFCWQRCQQPIVCAIIAASIYSKLGMFYQGHLKKTHLLHDKKALFQERANKLIEMAYMDDQTKALSLLEMRNKRWGDRNLMQLAYIGNLRTFVANPTCQHVVDSSWRRGFTKLRWYACFLCLFMPILTWTPLVRFTHGLGDDGGELTQLQKIYVFYRTPIAKYTGSCISFFVLILLYSYVALFSFRWNYQYAEVVLYLWILILILDELREVMMAPSKTFRGKLVDYIDSVWNQFDMLLYGLTTIAIVLRNFRATFMASRIMFACNAALYHVRIFRIYHANPSLGPKLVIFHRMIPEIVTFMFLLVIFILGYGVASQAMIDPYRLFRWSELGPLIFDIFFLPYWQMYGELSLDSTKVKETAVCPSIDVTRKAFLLGDTHCYPEDIEDIYDYEYVIKVLLAVYLLAGNVMLLNLLIAIFTSVFTEVHENSNEVWKWEMYRLVDEYDKRPGLAPPFILLEDAFKLIKAVWKRTCRKKKENLDLFMLETVNTLKLFERDCMSKFVDTEAKAAKDSLAARMTLLEDKTNQLFELFEESPAIEDNWGEVIDTEQKLFKSSEESSDLEEALEAEKSRFRKRRKGRKMQMPLGDEDTKVVRLRTARSSRFNRQLKTQIIEVKEQLSKLEDLRRMDKHELREANHHLEERLENALHDLAKPRK